MQLGSLGVNDQFAVMRQFRARINLSSEMPSLLLAQLTVNWFICDYYCASAVSLSSWGGASGFLTPITSATCPFTSWNSLVSTT